MTHDIHHDHLIKELASQLAPVFEKSPQAVYLYLDDTHKICNQKFADLLGYKSIDEWVAYPTPVSDVSEENRAKTIDAYMDASRKFKASTFKAEVISKKGKKIKT